MKILITGRNSYIGNSFAAYLGQWPERYQVDKISLRDGTWKETDFSSYDTVLHVAGIAHSDTSRVSEETKKRYYEVNTDLTIEVAKKAKRDGVRQFVFMSSAIVYGDSAPVGKQKVITRDTPVSPANFYGDSKVQAENGILPLDDERFRVVIIRAPMIYGKGSKGNYPLLSRIAKKMPVFPCVANQRSMIYIENLVEFLRLMAENKEHGIFWPQNDTYSNTSQMVAEIANVHGKHVVLVPGLGWMLQIVSKMTGLVNKAFGNLVYSEELSEYRENYQVRTFKESIERTESDFDINLDDNEALDDDLVSVVMPLYNCEDYLDDTIRSVLAQTYKNWELLIVDDCSTDNSVNVAKLFHDDRIKILHNKENMGAAVSRNVAIKAAKGRWIAFLDSDDIWKPEKLEKQLSYMCHNRAAFTCTVYGKIDEKGVQLPLVVDDSKLKSYEDLLKGCPGNSTVIYDAKTIGKTYVRNIKKRNDYVLWLAVIKKSGSLQCIPELLGYHRVREGSISSKKLKLVKYHWHIYRKIEKLGFCKSSYLVVYWCAKGVVRKLKLRT